MTDHVHKMVSNLVLTFSNLSQVRQPTVPLWQPWAVICPRPLTSQHPVTSSWSAGLRTMAQIREASKFAMLVSTKVCIPTLFHYYSLLSYCMEIRTEVDWDRQKHSNRKCWCLIWAEKWIIISKNYAFDLEFTPVLLHTSLLSVS